MDQHLEIKKGVLVRCSEGLKHVDVPEGVEEIGYMAFAECKSLESVYIPLQYSPENRAKLRDYCRKSGIFTTSVQ